ncbi:ATP-binding protein [Streptomyces sp. BE133]|uniref:ATP-binding protein n=1 Tax=Streptomyces sp. BE133 TaxID=3002523 RepID=UPI002E78BF0A|nr:AAA family ATPase [Streptomyces sp. BE133]MEE1813360.1 AAA family ATPase [Streptomyces sp. BE133]
MSGTAHSAPTGATAPRRLRIQLLDGFRVERDGGAPVAVHWRRSGGRTLVKLLAVTPGGRLHRDRVMDTLWPDAPREAALRSLRVTLHAARHALEPELPPRTASSYLHTEGDLLRLDPELVRVDADAVEEAALCALASEEPEALGSALTALGRELLPEDRYADWAEERRRRLAALRARIVPVLAGRCMAAGQQERAVEVLRAELDRVPTDEELQLRLARVLLDASRPRQAVRQYHVAREILMEELGVLPGAEFEALLREALDALVPRRSGASGRTVRTPQPLPPPVRRPYGTPLIGRARALALLLEHVQVCETPSDQAGTPLALVLGEAGVGKTRLMAETARQAAELGVLVLWGSCHEAEGQTPYGAFVDALDGYLAARPSEERAAVAAEHPGLAAVLTTLGQAPGNATSPEEEQGRFFRAVAALLTDLAAERPVLIVLDDLHAGDPASVGLLHHLVRTVDTRRWRFLAAVRDEELSPDDRRRITLDSLVAQGLAAEIDLLRLSRANCARLTGAPPERARRIYELSRGNPLFALELSAADPLETVPSGVNRLVGGRLTRLPADCRAVLGVLAVGGGGAVGVAELECVAAAGLHPPLGAAAVAAALDAAVEARMIYEREVTTGGRTAPGYAFRHPLVRLACAERLGAATRRRLHRAYADTLLDRRPDAVDALAFHLGRADDPRAPHWLRRAAERAAALFANDSACAYYADLVSRLDADQPLAAARARLDWGIVLRRSARYQEAESVLRTAYEEFGRAADEHGVIGTAVALAEVLGRAARPDEGLALLEAVRARLAAATAGVGHALRADLELAVGALNFGSGAYEGSLAALARAEAAAERLHEAEALPRLARALSARAAGLLVTGRLPEARAAADRALPYAERCGDVTLLSGALSTAGEIARHGQRMDVARDCARRAMAAARRTGDPAVIAFDQANLATLEFRFGEHRRALALAKSAVRRAGSLGPSWALPYALAGLAEVLLGSGRLDEAAAAIADCERASLSTGDAQVLDGARRLAAELAAARG